MRIITDERTIYVQRVRHARIQRGMTQSELAIAANIRNRNVVSGYETGWRGISIQVAIRLAKALGMSLDELFVGGIE